MSAAPTSGDKTPEPASLAQAGWSEADYEWERAMEAGAERHAAGDSEAAEAHWNAALEVARVHFGRDDPRLAASLTNCALSRRRAGDRSAAGLFEEAAETWRASATWIDALRPEQRARSSLFHLRLERKHPGGYHRFSRERYDSLASRGRAATEAHRDGTGGYTDGLSRWRSERPQGYTDARKLMAAAYLIAAGSDEGDAA